MGTLRLAAATVVAALLTTACAGIVQDSDPGATDSAVTQTDALAHLGGDHNAIHSGEFEVSDLEGRPVVLWFWAPWCVICRSEAPHIAEFAAELDQEGSAVAVVGVAGLGDRGDMERFVDDTGVGQIAHLVDSQGDIWSAFGVISHPAYVLVSASGEAETINGVLSPEQLREKATALAEE